MTIFTLGDALFAVTVGLIAGLFFVWRRFQGAGEEEAATRAGSSVVPVLLTIGTMVLAIVATRFSLRSSTTERPATVADEVQLGTDESTEGSSPERSLFESRIRHGESNRSSAPKTVMTLDRSFMGVLIPVVLIIGIIAFIKSRLRETLTGPIPVFLAAVLVGFLFLSTWRNHEIQQAQQAEAVAIQEARETAMRRFEQQREDRQFVEQIVEQVPVASTTEGEDKTTPDADKKPPNSATDTAEPSESTDAEPPVTEYVGTELFGTPRETLPAWTTSQDQDSTIQVIRTGKHATVEDAEREALTQLRSQLKAEFLQNHPEAAGWVPPDRVVLNSGSLLQRAVERSEIQVGEFVSPMYRTYWQVDTSVEKPLYQAWRPEVVKRRLIQLSGLFGLLTLIFGTAAGCFHADAATSGRHRRKIMLAAFAGVGITGGLVLAMLA